MHPEVGQLAIVRKRPFIVTEIIPSAPGLGGDCSKPSYLIKLSSVEDDGLGEELQVIWELEPGTAVHEKSTLPNPDSFDHPKRLQAFLEAVRWGGLFPRQMTKHCNLRFAAASRSTTTSWIPSYAHFLCCGSIC